MSDTDSTIRQSDIRIAIKRAVDRHETTSVAEVVTAVSREYGCRETAVKDQLDTLEREGFVYLVGNGAEAEVRMP